MQGRHTTLALIGLVAGVLLVSEPGPSHAAEPIPDVTVNPDGPPVGGLREGVNRIGVVRDFHGLSDLDGPLSIEITTVPDGPDPTTPWISATPGIDYEPVTMTLEWDNGDNSDRWIDLEIFRDGVYEKSEAIWFLITYDGDVREPNFDRIVVRDREVETLDEPARLFDTRLDGETIDDTAVGTGRITGGEVIEVPVAGRAGVPLGVTGAAINVTAIDPADQGFITLFPCTDDVPTTSALNYRSGEVRGNGALTALSANGTICVLSRVDTDLTIDVTGYAADGSPVETTSPQRLLDTRPDGTTVDGVAVGGGPIAGGMVRRVTIGGRAGLPDTMQGVFLNVTAVGPSAQGFLTVYRCDRDRPIASSVNFPAGFTTGNSTLTAATTGGDICVFARSTTHVVIDVTGVAQGDPDASTGVFHQRLVDTRGLSGAYDGGGRLQAGEVRELSQFDIDPSLPYGFIYSRSHFLNVTVVDPAGDGNVRVFPCGLPVPSTSTVNFAAGDVRGNSGLVRVNANLALCVWSLVDTDVVIDSFGGWNVADGDE